jgi:hypothetical protein
MFRRDRNRQHVKGLPIFRGQFAAFPGAVREYKLQELPSFGCRLTLEQDVSAAGQFQELDAFLDIAAVGRLMAAKSRMIAACAVRNLRCDAHTIYIYLSRRHNGWRDSNIHLSTHDTYVNCQVSYLP